MTTLIAEASLPADWYDGASQVLFLFRVIIGVTLAAHGYNKFFGGGKIAGTARWFDSMGMKPNGTVHAYLAASTEIGSGVLMALGCSPRWRAPASSG
jgi:putative oxidoreductase